MATPTAAWRTAVRATTVAGLTAGLLIVGVAGAQAAGTPAPNSDLLGGLTGVIGGLMNGTGPSGILPIGLLGAAG